MATVSSAYSDNVLYDWVSDASDCAHEDELIYGREEDNSSVEGASPTSSDAEDGDLIEFDGTAPDTEYFLDASAMQQLSAEEDYEDDPELQQYISSLAAISTFDFSSVHVPSPNGPLSTGDCMGWAVASEYPGCFPLVMDTSLERSLLSSGSDCEPLQVMSDSIHLAVDGNTLLGVPTDTPCLSGFATQGTRAADDVTLHSPLDDNHMDFFGMLHEKTHSKMQTDVASMFSTSEDEASERSELLEDCSAEPAQRPGTCLKTLLLQSQAERQQQEGANNSPSKQQATAKSMKSLPTSKTLAMKQRKTKQRKRRRNLVDTELAFPQDDTVFTSDDSDEDHVVQPKLKRRRTSKLKQNTAKRNTADKLPLPNLVRKKYLIALNDPRFVPQLHDPELRSNFFAYEQVLRVIETEDDSDVDIV